MAGVTRFSTYSSPIGGPPNSPATKLFSLMVSNSVSYLFLYVGYLNLTPVFILNKTGTFKNLYCTSTVHVQILTQFYYPHTSSYSYSYRTKALTVVAQGFGFAFWLFAFWRFAFWRFAFWRGRNWICVKWRNVQCCTVSRLVRLGPQKTHR